MRLKSKVYNKIYNIFTLILLCSIHSHSSFACYWDSDTLKMEKQKFPKVYEMILGHFPNRSKEFYLWRIKDREKKLKEFPNDLKKDQWTEDLMVAFDRVGESKKAIELAKSLLTLFPNRYELHANLGTFYFHSGILNSQNYKLGKEHIQKALKLNPKAHFGREKIQLALVEYVIQKSEQKTEQDFSSILDPRKKSNTNLLHWLPLFKNESDNPECIRILHNVLEKWTSLSKKQMDPTFPWICPSLKPFGFAKYVLDRQYTLQDGVRGILGMMYFSNHQHPILLEALGDLLLAERFIRDKNKTWKDAKHLAALAYLKASEHVPSTVAPLYKAKALLALVGIRKFTYQRLQRLFNKAHRKQQVFINQLRKKETQWINEHPDPDLAFFKEYEQWIHSFYTVIDAAKP